MQQHQQQLRIQQQQQQAQLRGGAVSIRPGQPTQAQQFPQQNQPNFLPQQQQQQQQPRAPQSGTTAQTAGFINDGSFSPATGHSQPGMPFKSAGGFQQQQQISSTSSNQELSELKEKFLKANYSLVNELSQQWFHSLPNVGR